SFVTVHRPHVSSGPTDLSEMLAEGTKESHDRAENCQFVKDFLRGRIQRELFKVGSLYFVYSALEEEIEKNKDHPHIAPIYFPTELHRHEALARDLEYFYGEDWESQVSKHLSAGTKPYVDRIHEVGEKDPVLLVAHSYTRYMGDLSGGQILKKVAQRALKLPPTGEGLNFYYFEGIHSHKSFKQLYRSRMNELELQTDTKERIIDESNRAFGFNMMVRQHLGGCPRCVHCLLPAVSSDTRSSESPIWQKNCRTQFNLCPLY
uniref:Heme oxygenase n=1 Tax=Echeneis naucrates TaxID=173247 RepID=A0A665WNS0_ECHNA